VDLPLEWPNIELAWGKFNTNSSLCACA